MSLAFKTVSNWTRSAIGLALLSGLFVFNAAAQADTGKPLDAATLAALVTELKGVVASNATVPGEAAMVSKKWDARTDLAGKTKLAVINLLYEDVRSSVRDAGTQYQISSIFGMYRMMPDDAIKAEGPKANAAMTKAELVSKLIELTYRTHPDVGPGLYVNNVLVPLTIKGTDARVAAARQVRFKDFDFVLEKNNTWTPAQKAFIKANYDQLLKTTIKITEDAGRKNFPVEQWIKEGLEKSYTSRFTPVELSTLITYFQGDDGRDILKYNQMAAMADISEEFPAKGDTAMQAASAKYDKFLSTPLGAKFKTAYFDDATAYKEAKEKAAWAADPNADGSKVYSLENLNQLFTQFVADNYKK